MGVFCHRYFLRSKFLISWTSSIALRFSLKGKPLPAIILAYDCVCNSVNPSLNSKALPSMDKVLKVRLPAAFTASGRVLTSIDSIQLTVAFSSSRRPEALVEECCETTFSNVGPKIHISMSKKWTQIGRAHV